MTPIAPVRRVTEGPGGLVPPVARLRDRRARTRSRLAWWSVGVVVEDRGHAVGSPRGAWPRRSRRGRGRRRRSRGSFQTRPDIRTVSQSTPTVQRFTSSGRQAAQGSLRRSGAPGTRRVRANTRASTSTAAPLHRDRAAGAQTPDLTHAGLITTSTGHSWFHGSRFGDSRPTPEEARLPLCSSAMPGLPVSELADVGRRRRPRPSLSHGDWAARGFCGAQGLPTRALAGPPVLVTEAVASAHGHGSGPITVEVEPSARVCTSPCTTLPPPVLRTSLRWPPAGAAVGAVVDFQLCRRLGRRRTSPKTGRPVFVRTWPPTPVADLEARPQLRRTPCRTWSRRSTTSGAGQWTRRSLGGTAPGRRATSGVGHRPHARRRDHDESPTVEALRDGSPTEPSGIWRGPHRTRPSRRTAPRGRPSWRPRRRGRRRVEVRRRGPGRDGARLPRRRRARRPEVAAPLQRRLAHGGGSGRGDDQQPRGAMRDGLGPTRTTAAGLRGRTTLRTFPGPGTDRGNLPPHPRTSTARRPPPAGAR